MNAQEVAAAARVENSKVIMQKRARFSSFVGTTIEWYDFFIYGTMAALIFNQLFFPKSEPLTGTLAAFATFAVGFLARPLGALLFGHFGDRIGRRAMLVSTLTLMGVATFLIGLLPTYEHIGLWAALLLTILRVCQGLAIGGEWGGAALMTVEHAPADKRGFYGAWPQMGVPAGLLLATGAVALVALLPNEAFLSWGWRLPFLLSTVLVVVGIVIRVTVDESPLFEDVVKKESVAKVPMLEILREHRKSFLLVVGSRFADNGSFFIYSVFVISFATSIHRVPRPVVLGAVVFAAAVLLVTLPLFAALSDRIGRRRVFLFGAGFNAAFAFPFFYLIETGRAELIVLAVGLALGAGFSAMYAPQAAYYSELFGTRARYSGIAVGSQLAAIAAGGPAPMVATALVAAAGGASWPIALWLIGLSTITFMCVFGLPETAGVDLRTAGSERRGAQLDGAEERSVPAVSL